MAVETLHNCRATHRESVSVHERSRGKTAWLGAVEVFDIIGNPEASQCFAWIRSPGADNDRARFVAILAVPPITTPQEAVRASIAADFKKR